MKMTARLLSLLLCVALFMEFCPLDALAAGNIASESALETAWTLSGQDPDAAHWHRGMTPEATWNAEQLDEWLDYVLGEPLFSVQNAHSDMKVNLYKIQESAPSDYNRLMAGSNGLYLEYMTGASHRAEDLRQQLRAYRTNFIMYADKIASLIDSIRDDSVNEREKIRYSRQLEKAVAVIRRDRAEVVANYRGWLEQIDAWHADFTGESNAAGRAWITANGGGGAGLGDWVKEVMSWHEDPIKTTVSVELHPDGRNNSVLAKLSTAHSALAAQETDTQTIHVIPDTQFVVNLNTPVEIVDPSAQPGPAPSPMPVLNGTVTVWDAKDVRNPDTDNPYSTAAVTEINGDATFNVSEFTVDEDGFMDLGIVAQADGYQTVKHYVAQVQKGGVYEIPMIPEGEVAPDIKPYFYNFEFNRMPTLGVKALIYNSPENDITSDIVVGVVYPNGYTGSRAVTLKYFDVTKTDPETKKLGTWTETSLESFDGVRDPRFKGGAHTLYTFSKNWNQILGPGKKVSCYIGKESDGLVAEDIGLTVKRGVVDKPIFSDSGIGTMTGITNTYKDIGNLLRVQLPSYLPYPFGGSALDVNIPIFQNLPKISWDIDGTLTIAYGVDPGFPRDYTPPDPTFGPQPSDEPEPTPVPKHWYDDRTWRSKTQNEIDREAKLREKKTAFSKYKAKCGAMWDGLKPHVVNFLGNMSFSSGAFAMITGQFHEHKEDGDEPFYYNCRSVSGTIGAIGTFTAGATWTLSVIGYVSFDISTSLALGLTLGFEWYNFDPVHSNFGHLKGVTGSSGATIKFKVMISVTAGIGIKGVAGASVTGYGFISITISLTVAAISGEPKKARVSVGAGISALVEVFWVKYTLDIWTLPERVVAESKNSQSAFNLLDLFTAPALAEEDDAPEAMTPAEPEYYPALVPEATQVMDDVSMQNKTVKYADLGDETFAFYIAAMEDGKARLTWRNLATGQTGNAQAALQEIADAREDECGVQYKIDYAFDVQGETGREGGGGPDPLKPTLIATVLCTSRVTDEKVETDGGTVFTKAPTDSFVYYLILTSDGDGGLKNQIFEGRFHTVASTWIIKTRHGFKSLPLEFACADIDMATYELIINPTYKDYYYKILLHGSAREYVPHSENNDVDTGRNINIYIDFDLPTDLNSDTVSTSLSSDIPLLPGNTVRYQCGSTFPVGLRETRTAWYAMERAGDDGPGMLVHGMDGVDRNPLTSIQGKDANDDVVFYTVLHDGRTDYTNYAECIDSVFFLARTQDDNGDHYWLKQAAVKTVDSHRRIASGTTAYTITDYDVEIKAGSFYAQKVNGVIYIYWVATAQKEKEADPDIYRIKSVIYDPYSDTMSNELVLAEFSMPEAELIPAKLFLSENGLGYCTATVGEESEMRADVYSFPVNWITSLELNAMILSDTHANPGKWLDTVVSVMNSGNTGISRFDLELYNVAEDGTETVVETLHCDCLNPGNSAVYEGGRQVSSGVHTIQRLEDGVKPMQQPDHNVTRESWNRDSGFSDDWNQYFDSAMLLPGAVKAYSMPLYIPENWDGYKTLFLRVKTAATRANWLAANVAAGSAEKSNAMDAALDLEQNPEIVYTRAADGTMVRTDNVNALLAANGNNANAALSFSPLYPDKVRGTESLAMNHDIHDLDVSHRVYFDANGYEYIAITFLNQADTGRPLKLDAYVYMDGDSEPMEVALPYYPDKTTDSYTHTVTLRLDDLLGGNHPRNATVVIEPEGVEETALRNNQFTLHFDDDEVDDPLRIVLHPSPVSALPSETVSFKVKAAGGVKPYTYQWQVWMGEKTGWKDIPDSNSSTLTVENVTLAMHGRKARCVVTDHYLNRVVSDEAMLTVIGAGGGDLPETGDDTNLPLYIAVALLGLALLWWIRRREKSM